MSLFDVIRYPISDIPTEDQLAALPEDLLDKWLDHSEFLARDYWTFTRIVSFYVVRKDDNKPYKIHPEIIVLRKMIKEYDGLV